MRPLVTLALAVAWMGSLACVQHHDLGGPADAGSFDVGPEDAAPPDVGPTDLGPTDLGPTDAGELATECERTPGARCVRLDEGGACPGGAAPLEASCGDSGDESGRVCCPE